MQLLNNKILTKFNSKVYRNHLSHRELDPDSNGDLSIDLEQLRVSGFPPSNLKLKRGAPIMVLRNIDCSHGLCNGTRLIVLELHKNIIVGKIINGKFKNSIATIPRIIFSTNPREIVQFSLKQFPIKLAFVTTINKSQGESYAKVGVYFNTRECFSHGQLYVAMSRCRSKKGLKIFKLKEKSKTVNIVNRQIL